MGLDQAPPAVAAAASSLAPGFRFHPTDQELVGFYLRRKVFGKPFRFDPISVIDIYKCEPWDLPGKSRLKSRDLEWYFFSALDKKYGKVTGRTNRATEKGYWKTTGKDRPIRYKSRTVGMKKTLVYHCGRAPRGERTNWVMHEYKLVDEEFEKTGNVQDAMVLCRVFRKSGTGPKNGEQYGAPFDEEEWDDELVLVPGQDDTEGAAGGDDAYLDGNDLEQILGADISSEDVPLPLSFYYEDSSSHFQEPLVSDNDNQKLLVDVGENYSAPEQPDGQNLFDLPVQNDMYTNPVRYEYIGEPSHSVNSEDADYLLDDPFLDATDNPPFDEGAFLEANDLSNSVKVESSGFDILEDYLTFFDSDENENLVSDQASLAQTSQNPNYIDDGDTHRNKVPPQILPEFPQPNTFRSLSGSEAGKSRSYPASRTDKLGTSGKVGMGAENSHWHLELNYDQWVALSVSGSRPSARYKHAAAVVDTKLYISGGSRNGRYLSDVQVFDLETLAWSSLKLSTEPNVDKINDSLPREILPATSGHSMFKWGNKLLLVGGHSKNISANLSVWFIDLESHHCGVAETTGKVPVARGGQSLTLVGSKLIMFGGEDGHRQLMNDVHILDMETMTWDVLAATQTPPAPRFDHTAAVHAERYLLIFGGCSHSIFFNDLHVLDLETMEWSQPQIQGDLVTPRAGHAGITIDENWYIVGGGDNRSGAPETLVLNMSKLVMTVLTSVGGRDPLASEGVSLSSVLLDGEEILVAFGGYNGKYNNEVYVMRPKPRDSPHPKIFQSPAAAAAAASVTAAYALSKSGKLEFSEMEDLNIKLAQGNGSQWDLASDITAIREEKKMLESALAKVRADNSSFKGKIDETTGTHADLSKELHSVQGQLNAERSRCAKLEAQISELQKMLESSPSIEEEVQLLRKQKSAWEHDMELASAVQRQSSGGVWKWMSR